jgi:hypothetical protein
MEFGARTSILQDNIKAELKYVYVVHVYVAKRRGRSGPRIGYWYEGQRGTDH